MHKIPAFCGITVLFAITTQLYTFSLQKYSLQPLTFSWCKWNFPKTSIIVNDQMSCSFVIDQDIMYINFYSNCQFFATCLVYYSKLIAMLDTFCQKSMLICVISDINHIVHPNISHLICIFTVFLSVWMYRFGRVIKQE